MKTTFNVCGKSVVRILVIAALFTSCVSVKNTRLLQDAGTGNSVSHTQKPAYRLKTGDHLYIRVYSIDPKTSKFFQTDFPTLMNSSYIYLNSYSVDQDGYIHFSFIDKMMVKGMTVEELKKKLQETLNEYFTEATVTIKLVNFQVSVLGEVNNPGTYTIDKDQVDLFQALGLAGGLNPFGNIRKVMLIRQTESGSDIQYLDLSGKDILASEYYYLLPNDMIYVEPRKTRPFVMESFPYAMTLSGLAVVLSILSIMK